MNKKTVVTQIEQSKKADLPDEFVLHFMQVHYTKTYYKKAIFKKSAFDRTSWAWLSEPIGALSRQSSLNPSPSNPTNLLRALKIARCLRAWKELVATPVNDVTLEQVISLYSSFEAEVSSYITVAPNVAAKLSGAFRHFVTSFLKSKSADIRIRRLGRHFESKLQHIKQGRELISDMPDEARPPLGATPHLDISELLRKQSETLRADSERIRDACVGVLKRYLLAIQELHRLTKAVVPDEAVEAILELMSSKEGRCIDPLTLTVELQEHLLAMVVQIAKGLRPARYPSKNMVGRTWEFTLLQATVPMLRTRLFEQSNGNSILRLAKIDVAPSAEVLLACALILQLHTKWNIASVLALNEQAIRITSYPHSLQSVKSRTGDHTPIVFILASDESAILACSILSDRLDRLAKFDSRTEDESNIWASSRSVLGKGPLNSVVGWSTTLKTFCRNYGLVDFSFEQLRVQRLGELHVQTGSLDNVRFEAGHTQLQTSMHYVDKLMLSRMNSAILLEFERRLDATIRYMINPESVPKIQKLISYPLGDGTACVSPKNPPEESWLIAGVCNGKECNSNGGCRHRTIEVTEGRVEEVVLLRRFYERNWNRLLNENEEQFRKYHEPALLFNFAFYGLLRKGPYRYLVSKYETQA